MLSIKENRAKTQLLWIGIGSICMFFAGLTSAVIVRRAEGNWLEFSLPNWFLFSTITIIISSMFLIIASSLIKKNKQPTTYYNNFFVVHCFCLFSI